MAPGEAPPAVNTNNPDGAEAEKTHLKDPTGAGESALPAADSEAGKKSVSGQRSDARTSAQSMIPDDLFDDDSDDDDSDDYVPRGGLNGPTEVKTIVKPAGPIRKPTGGAGQAAPPKNGATAKTEKQKEPKTQKKDAKAAK